MNARGPFEAIHVISDLHWGDTARRRIFREEDRLTRWIHALAGTPGPVALVLNGDIFDFIASYSEGCYVDPVDAVQQVDAILGADGPRAQGPDALFALTGVAAALRAFVSADEHQLVLVIGNHDVELAFPEVLDRVLHWICDHEAANAAERALRRTRVETRLNGEGWRGFVGSPQGLVYCVHGNAVDLVNVVDHDGLRELDTRVSRGELAARDVHRRADAFYEAPWGTRFVVDVMNAAKDQYPFVDLLKPEGAALARLLLHLDPSLAVSRLDELLATVPSLARQRIRGAVLSASPARGAQRRPGGGAAAPRGVSRQRIDLQDIERLEDLAEGNVDAVDLVAQGTLGMFANLANAVSEAWRTRSERTLWQALRESTRRERHRAVDDVAGDDFFDALDAKVGRDVLVLIAGHTHAARLIARRSGGPLYANSGTWIELLRFPPEVFDTEVWSAARDGFRRFIATLRACRIDALGALRDGDWIGTAVTVTLERGALRCTLHRPGDTDKPIGRALHHLEVDLP